MQNSINLKNQPTAQQRDVLTKKKLLDMIQDLPDDFEIRVDIKLSDVAKAKKCMHHGDHQLEFELSTEVVTHESSLSIAAWVHADRLPTPSERIMGVVLVEREVGTVKWFNDSKGLGFILRPDGQDVFVHYEAIRGDGFRCLRAGSEVEYTLYQTSKGLQAQDVITLSEPAEEEIEEYNASYA